MNNIKQTYSTRELMHEQELASYITDGQRKQFAEAGCLQTNSIKALQRSLEVDYEVERSRGKWTLTKRSTGSLPPFMLDERLTRGKTEIQLLILTRFNNYIAKLQRLSDGGNAVVSKTIKGWIVGAELMSNGILSMQQQAETIGQLDNQINKFYGHYSNQLNYQLRQFFFSQINSKALDLNIKKVAMIQLIERDEEQGLQTVKLTDSELASIEKQQQALMNDDKYSAQFYKSRQLNEAGRYELNMFVYDKFKCSNWWYEYQIDLSSFSNRQILDEQDNATELIRDAFRAYRTEQVIKQEYERPYYNHEEAIKMAMIEKRYYSITNQADALLDIAETDSERVNELRQQYDETLTELSLDSASKEVLEAYNLGFIPLEMLKLNYQYYYVKAQTKLMLE